MAIGLSGSNGGIDRAYKAFAVEDVGAGLRKYQNMLESENLPHSVRPLYEEIVRNLAELHFKLAGSRLEQTALDA